MYKFDVYQIKNDFLFEYLLSKGLVFGMTLNDSSNIRGRARTTRAEQPPQFGGEAALSGRVNIAATG